MLSSPLKDNEHGKRLLVEDDLIEIHHQLMLAYGWINIEDFKKLPIITLLNLFEKVQQHNFYELEYKKRILKGLGYKIR